MIAIASKINHPAVVALRQRLGGLPHLVGGPDHQPFEVFKQKLLGKEVILHDRLMIEASQASLHTHAVEALQNPNDFFPMLLYKLSHGTTRRDCGSFHNQPSFYPEGGPFSNPLVAALPR